MQPNILLAARQKIGEYLKGIRLFNGLSIYAITKATGLHDKQVQAIESGETAYTIDSFLKYSNAVNCYFYLASKDGKDDKPHDLDHLVKQADNPI